MRVSFLVAVLCFGVAHTAIVFSPLSSLTVPTVAVSSTTPNTRTPAFVSLSGAVATYDASSNSANFFPVQVLLNDTAGVSFTLTAGTNSYTFPMDYNGAGPESNQNRFRGRNTHVCLPANTYTVSLSAVSFQGLKATFTTTAWSQVVVSNACANIPSLTALKLPNQVGTSNFMGTVNGTANAGVASVIVGPSGSPGALINFVDIISSSGSVAINEQFPGRVGYPSPTSTLTFGQVFSYDGDFVPQNGVWTVNTMYITSSINSAVGRSYSTADLTTLGFDTTFTVSGGTNDVTAPTCTSVTVDLANVTSPSLTVQFTVVCTDNTGGVGLGKFGLLYAYDLPVIGLSQTYTAFTSITYGSNVIQVTAPDSLEATLRIQGVLVADLAGNLALYGTCGDYAGGPICPGGGSSGASSLSVSVFALAAIMLALSF